MPPQTLFCRGAIFACVGFLCAAADGVKLGGGKCMGTLEAVVAELRAMKLKEAAKKVEDGIEGMLTYCDITECVSTQAT